MITVRHHNAGVCNQILNLELAVGLSFLHGKVIMDVVSPFTPRPSKYFDEANNILRDNDPLFIYDVMDIPEEAQLEFSNVSVSVNPIEWILVQERFVNVDLSKDVPEEFADGKIEVDVRKDQSFGYPSLAYYSVTFANRTKEFDRFMSRVIPKKAYSDMARKVADSIGEFNGIHLRRGDHTAVVDVTGKDVAHNVKFDVDRPVVIATDEPDTPGLPESFIIIEKYILDNFIDDFNALPRRTSDVFALICNLVLHHAIEFFGTQTSTYTGYIQRAINQRSDSFRFKFINNFIDDRVPSDNQFSWNSYKFPGKNKSVLREWPESKLDL